MYLSFNVTVLKKQLTERRNIGNNWNEGVRHFCEKDIKENGQPLINRIRMVVHLMVGIGTVCWVVCYCVIWLLERNHFSSVKWRQLNRIWRVHGAHIYLQLSKWTVQDSNKPNGWIKQWSIIRNHVLTGRHGLEHWEMLYFRVTFEMNSSKEY